MPRRGDKPTLSLVEATSPELPKPPRKLGKHGLALWNRVQSEYSITDSGGIELLVQICAAADRAELLAESVERDGAVVYTRSGAPRSHPAVKDELACRAYIARGLERLGILSENIKAIGRPGAVTTWTG
jgi:hypothetical protein